MRIYGSLSDQLAADHIPGNTFHLIKRCRCFSDIICLFEIGYYFLLTALIASRNKAIGVPIINITAQSKPPKNTDIMLPPSYLVAY